MASRTDTPAPAAARLDAAALARAFKVADAAGSARAAAPLLRECFPGLRVVVVDAFDMRHETPAAVGEHCRVYLGASDGHCWQVTGDPAQAAGLFVTERA